MNKGPNENNPYTNLIKRWISSHYILILTTVAGLVIAGIPGAIGFGLAIFAIELKLSELQETVKAYNPLTYLRVVTDLFSFNQGNKSVQNESEKFQQSSSSDISSHSTVANPEYQATSFWQRRLNDISIIATKLCGDRKKREKRDEFDNEDDAPVQDILEKDDGGEADYYEEYYSHDNPPIPVTETNLALARELEIESELEEYKRKLSQHEQTEVAWYEKSVEAEFEFQEGQQTRQKRPRTLLLAPRNPSKITKEKVREKAIVIPDEENNEEEDRNDRRNQGCTGALKRIIGW